MTRSSDLRPIQPIAAVRAVSRLIQSRGQDKPEAMKFLRALEGQSGRRAFERFRASPVGARVLRERPRLLDTLFAAAAADCFPEGTLGHAYRRFMNGQGIAIEGVMDLANQRDWRLPEDEAFAEERAAAMHDLWHVVTGYDADVLGEVCLMALRCAQLPHAGFKLLTLFMTVKPPKHARGAPVRRAVIEGYRIGRQAAWLRGVDWEAMLPMKLDDVRRLLMLSAPVVYQRVLAMNAAPGWAYPVAGAAAPRA